MSDNWDRVRGLIKDGIKVTKGALSSIKSAANAGSKKMSLYVLKSKLKERFAELGSYVYRLIEEEKEASLSKDNKSSKLIMDEITILKADVAKLEKEIKEENATTLP
jgi:hypothetical protein